MNKTILKYAIGHAVGAAVYIGLVAAFITYIPKIFGGDPGGYLGPVLFLLVFVISAAAMGLIIFARPAMWYMDGRKREALSLAFATLGFLIVIAALVFAGLYVNRGTGTEPVACTDEARLCPDGTAVGRTGPNCEFAACPTTRVPDNSTDTNENITVLNPKPNTLVTLPIAVSGYIRGNGWSANEGEAGTVQLFDANNTPVSTIAILTTTSDWLKLPTDFEATVGDREMVSHLETDTGYLLFKSTGAKDGDVVLTYRVPVTFRTVQAVQQKNRCVVAGCNGTLCIDRDNNGGSSFTTCESLPQYACYKTARCEQQSNGECGWTRDTTLTACLARFER
jgi:hypothetical protein